MWQLQAGLWAYTIVCVQAVQENGVIVALYVLAGVAMICLVKLLVHFTVVADRAPRPDVRKPVPVEMLKALVLHSQRLYIICSMVNIPWPPSLLVPMQALGAVWSLGSPSGSSIGLDCILHGGRLPVAIQGVLIALLAPLGILFIVVGFAAFTQLLQMRSRERRPASNAIGHGFAATVICVVFMFLPTWVNTALSLFTCVQLDVEDRAPYQTWAVGAYWAQDMSQQCYSPNGFHRRWALGLGIPLTVLFCLVLPSAVFGFMWYSRKRGKLASAQFVQHYGFMFSLWREEVCWWESVVLLQTIALVMVSTFGFALSSYYQAIIIAAILAMITMLHLAVKQFKCPTANKVAVASACILFFTAYLALTFLPFNSVGQEQLAVYSSVMGAVILVINIVFFIVTTWQLHKTVDWGGVAAGVKGFGQRWCKVVKTGVPVGSQPWLRLG